MMDSENSISSIDNVEIFDSAIKDSNDNVLAPIKLYQVS